ncbi:MAG: gamma-glutamylcyclotransferase [Alphaproteobacteria bacterium]|nr:gamma-glutamylcyclotransferase [Alphaproteobacteria bacterium]
MRLFLYGSLTDAAMLARRSGEPALARRLSRATLSGHRRVALRAEPYPTLIRDARAVVCGLLVPGISARALARLSAYEGPRYRLRAVMVRTASGACLGARSWIASPRAADPRRPWPPTLAAGTAPPAPRRRCRQ